jgi:CubicO group peptidase (beta-lactamase class C family)
MLFLVSLAYASWQTGRLRDHAIEPVEFEKFIDYAMDESDGRKTLALLVIHRGKILFERYAEGFYAESKFRLWSISKTVGALILAKAIAENLLSLETKVGEFYPDSPAKDVTLRELLQMSSGISYHEDYSNPFTSDTIAMLYGSGQKDMAQYTANLELKESNAFYYSSGDTNLAMGMLKKKMSLKDYAEFPWRSLFKPLGINNVTIERDASGTLLTSSYVYMSARDLAKLGSLMMRRGKYRGKSLIKEEWFNFMFSLAPTMAHSLRKPRNRNESYGGHIWLNKTYYSQAHETQLGPYLPSAPENTIIARGFSGQVMNMYPNKNLIVVRFAEDPSRLMDWPKFSKLLLGSFKEIKRD